MATWLCRPVILLLSLSVLAELLDNDDWLSADLVDRLSTPIQFMSLAEKRTKQMKGMGFDETDISDEAVTSSASMKQHPKPEQTPPTTLPTAAGAANGKTATPTTSQPRAPTPSSSHQVSVATDKKEKKGNIHH